ncbi:hypothetical protein APASM_0713 [Actinosynnema pretiosum subsp. pretiosum]|nr:hypothetical protein APASM_0713 [Actinosynnema pretiosum subsp. pretiosum]
MARAAGAVGAVSVARAGVVAGAAAASGPPVRRAVGVVR